MPKKKSNITNLQLHKAWQEIKSRRSKELEKAQKVAKLINATTGAKATVEVYDHELSYLNTLIIAVTPSWPESKRVDEFIASLNKVKFILPDNREIADGYFYKTSKKNQNVTGYYLYVKKPESLGAGC